MSGKTVFISYRRDSSGRPFARLLESALKHEGYDVFLDVDDIDAGKWANQILSQVPKRDHFLLLLTPSALDKCEDESDWVRREFELAVRSGRNIVPILEESVDLKTFRQQCPASMKGVFDFQIARVEHRNFERDIETLTGRYISPSKAPQESEKPPPQSSFDISRIIKYAPAELIGRESELKILSDAWQQSVNGEKKRPHILTFVALGGEGKTSLIAKWAAELAHQDWPGCDAAFAWSFYSQGTSEKTQASSDSFLKEALLFFGDVDMANSPVSSFDKGRRLGQLIGERRALLILDGLEPLQYAPTAPTGSELKDQGVADLLKALAQKNDSLCVITTRYSIPDLRNFWQTTAPEIKLNSLSTAAGVALLRKLDVKGTQKELEQLVSDVKGHALTLNLLGSYLRDAHAGDIRKRDLVKLEEADAEEQSGHAFHVMDAYVKSFKNEGERGARALSILRLLGLFDRPATVDCLNALWTGDEIGELTGPLIGVSEAQRNITLKRLKDAQLITINRDEGSQQLLSLDAHPHLREYFARQLRTQQPDAWRAAHRRLYEHLRDTTNEGDEPTLEDLQPLYQAVAHGCQAGLEQEACDKVYFDRITKGNQHYSWKKLGSFGSDLSAVACFFATHWSHTSSALSESWQVWVTGQAALYLRALGRLAEAVEPMRSGIEKARKVAESASDEAIRVDQFTNTAICASNLSELELTLGEVARAVWDAEQSVTYADRSRDAFQRMVNRTTHADALHQAGRLPEAERRFREAEQMQKEDQPDYPMLYSVKGFQYCDLLLAAPERAAWQIVLEGGGLSPLSLNVTRPGESDKKSGGNSPHSKTLRAVSERAAQTLKWAEQNNLALLTLALDHLTLGRSALYVPILESSDFQLLTNDLSHVDAAVDGLRRASQAQELPRGLVTRAWLRSQDGKHIGRKSAQEDLDEAWEIAERGPMRLFMADIHLYRARLLHAVKPYPWNKFADGSEGRGPKDDLADARKLIEQCGYWRRKEELEDAEEAAKNWD